MKKPLYSTPNDELFGKSILFSETLNFPMPSWVRDPLASGSQQGLEPKLSSDTPDPSRYRSCVTGPKDQVEPKRRFSASRFGATALCRLKDM